MSVCDRGQGGSRVAEINMEIVTKQSIVSKSRKEKHLSAVSETDKIGTGF